jgi:hypothetical protein
METQHAFLDAGDDLEFTAAITEWKSPQISAQHQLANANAAILNGSLQPVCGRGRQMPTR